MNSEGLRSASDCMEALFEEQRRPKLVTIGDGHFDVHDPELYGSVYSIPISHCSTRDDIPLWLRQLSEKTWVTPLVIEDFAHALIAYFNVKG